MHGLKWPINSTRIIRRRHATRAHAGPHPKRFLPRRRQQGRCCGSAPGGALGAARAPPRARPALGCRGPSGARATASAPPRAATVMSSSQMYVNVSRAWFLTYLRGRGGGGGGGGAGGGRDAALKAALPPGTVACARQRRRHSESNTVAPHRARMDTRQDTGMYAVSGSDLASRPTTHSTHETHA